MLEFGSCKIVFTDPSINLRRSKAGQSPKRGNLFSLSPPEGREPG